jgi:hypothetical protein
MLSLPSQNPDEPPGLLKILASVFSGVLFGLFLSKFDTPTENDRESVHPKNNPRSETTLGSSQIPVTTQVPPTPSQHYQPDRRKDNTPPWKKKAEIAAVSIAGGLLLINIFVIIGSWRAANAAKEAADWTKRQTQFLFEEQRPRVWVKMLDNIQVEVGKPITANVEVFNYSQLPAQVRAYGYAEIGPMVIEKVRDHPLDNLPEDKSIRIILLAPGKDFSVEIRGKVLSEEDLRLIINGTIEVVVYGHINYTDPRNPWLIDPHNPRVIITHLMSSFCFHRLKDGTVSVCPNYEPHDNTGYTNWDP